MEEPYLDEILEGIFGPGVDLDLDSQLSPEDILRGLIRKASKHDRQVPKNHQLAIFGLTPDIIRRFSRKSFRGLDIGCGKGALVKHFREMGYGFEGIDKETSEEPYFMNQWVTGINGSGGIPRPDSHYDLVMAFQNTTLNMSLTTCMDEITRNIPPDYDVKIDFRKDVKLSIEGQSIIYEGARVLRPNGRFLIYPSLDRIEDVMGAMLGLSGISHSLQPIDIDAVRSYYHWENVSIPDIDLDDDNYLFNISVITRTR